MKSDDESSYQKIKPRRPKGDGYTKPGRVGRRPKSAWKQRPQGKGR